MGIVLNAQHIRENILMEKGMDRARVNIAMHPYLFTDARNGLEYKRNDILGALYTIGTAQVGSPGVW